MNKQLSLSLIHDELRRYRTILSAQDAQDLRSKSSISFVSLNKQFDQLLRNCWQGTAPVKNFCDE